MLFYKSISASAMDDGVVTRRFDRLAALGCFVAAALIAAACLVGVVDLLRGCSDRRHGCAYVIMGLPTAIGIAALCAGVGYWMLPKLERKREGPMSEPPNER